jgi:hypothetical protein
MVQTSSHRRRTPHLHIVLITALALAAVYSIEIARRSPVAAASAMEPVYSLPDGYYDRDILLRISVLNPDARIVFTVDGSEPTRTTETVYTHAIHLSAATPAVTVIRARAVLPDGQMGPVASASYLVGIQATLPMLSLIIEPGDLWDPEDGIYANPLEKGDQWERPADVTYVDKDRRSGFHIPAGVRIHGGGSRRGDKKPLRLYFRREYGASRLEYPLFADGNVQSFKRLILHNGGQDWSTQDHWNWVLMRNQLTDRLALELNGYAARSQPALLFINGEPWGIYYIRERIDRHFLADHFDIESADLLDSPEHSWDSNIIMGDRKHWDHLMQFVETHDLTVPANYAYIQSQVDTANLIDYTVLQIYAANTDWPHHNVQMFRPHVWGGRWQWVLWDSDHCFEYRNIDTDSTERMMSCSHRETSGRDILLFQKLLENAVFRERFLSRAADLLNTTLAPQAVVEHIDSLAAELEPDIIYETMRWPSFSNWSATVRDTRTFAHLRPNLVRQHLAERLNLNGTAQLSFNPPASGSGSVAVNDTLLQNLPWQGIYFQGIPIQIAAAPGPGYRFAGWEPSTLPQTPAITLTLDTAQAITPRFVPLDDDAPRPGDVTFTTLSANGDSHVEGGWFELQVMRPGGVDLRGWRVTDNDTKTATDEGSLIFTDHPAFARVLRGTTIRVIVAPAPDLTPPPDDLNAWDWQMTLHTDNGNLDTEVDPGFNLRSNDNLALLAPGPTSAFDDDQGIAFISGSTAVTPASFGVLADGVLPDQ